MLGIFNGELLILSYPQIHRFSQAISEQCPFCGQTETLPHVYVRCDRLTPLFVFFKMLLAWFSFVFDFPAFIFGPSGRFNFSTTILIHFFLAQAKLAIYKTRKSKIQNDLYSTDHVLEMFKALCVSGVKLEFCCCSEVQLFEKQWCVRDAFCKIAEDEKEQVPGWHGRWEGKASATLSLRNLSFHINTSDMLASHNYWHWSLYLMDEGDYENVLNMYDKEIQPRFTHSGGMLDIVDACSLLYRLEIAGVDVSNRWLQLAKVCSSHYGDRVLVFNDLHLLMAALGAHDKGAQKLISGMEEAGQSSAEQASFYNSPGVPLAHAMVAHSCGQHEDVAAILSKLYASFGVVGGSGPQRDVFNLIFIKSLLKSEKLKDSSLARRLINVRLALRPTSKLNQRLFAAL
uniref:tetratricopeptide repeat protein 38 isoform X3 n=1 Tax=Myxine glutinosa TaxID=7769 RepID=UPI00358E00EE